MRLLPLPIAFIDKETEISSSTLVVIGICLVKRI